MSRELIHESQHIWGLSPLTGLAHLFVLSAWFFGFLTNSSDRCWPNMPLVLFIKCRAGRTKM